MNTILKLTVGGALAVGAVSANAAVGSPTSGASDAVLFAEVLNGSNVVASYAGDTGISITSLANGTYTGTSALQGDSNLSALFAADAAGDTLYWAVEGGQFQNNGTSSTQIKVAGYAQFVTTTTGNSTSLMTNRTTTNLTSWAAGWNNEEPSLQTNLGSSNSVEGPSTASAGLWDYNTPSDISGWYSNGPETGNTALSGVKLYYVTGGGTTAAKIAFSSSYTLGLSSNGLTIASAVPLPPAVWLLGSGLLGLAGIARRKSRA